MEQKIVFFLRLAIFCLLLQACHTKNKKIYSLFDKIQLIRADEAFSNMSGQYGMKKAFLEYMDNDGVLLRPNHMPVAGADAIEYISQASDTAYKLTWKPSAADISLSGELGFTYGVYTLALRDTTFFGTYVSVWKKQGNGKWKFVLDSGNEGIKADTAK